MIRKFVRALGLKIAQTIGTPITDFQSGKPLGRAIMIPWRGKIHVIGIDVAVRHVAVRPMFQPQKRLTYWKQEIVFMQHSPPDFPRERDNGMAASSTSQDSSPN